MSVQTMLRKEKDGTLYKNTKLSSALEDVREKTKKTINKATHDNRMTRALDDMKNVIGTLQQKAGVQPSPSTDIKTRFARLLERRGDLKEKYAGKYGKNSAGFDLQGKTEVQEIPIAIENRKGSVREGKNPDGTEWRTKFKTPYGYLEGTKGADGDEIDVYVGPNKNAPNAFVVRQKNPDGKHDEDTVMLGYPSKGSAKKDILRHYEDKSQVGEVVGPMSVEMLKAHLARADGKKITKLGEDEALNKALLGAVLAGGGLAGIGETPGELLGYQRIFHGTTKDNAKKIRQEGFDPTKGGTGAAREIGNKRYVANSKGKVHVTPSRDTAERYARFTGTEGSRAARAKAALFGSGKGKGDVVQGAVPFEQFKTHFSKDPDLLGGYTTDKRVSSRLLQQEGESAFSAAKRALPKDYKGYVTRNKGRFLRGAARPLATAAGLYSLGSAAKDEFGSKAASSDQAPLSFRDGDPPHMTGIPAKLRRRKGDVPTRMEDPYPPAVAENRQENQQTKLVDGFASAGGDDVAKVAEALSVDRALGDERKFGEGPTRGSVGASPVGKHRLPSARGVEGVHLTNISTSVGQDESKTAAPAMEVLKAGIKKQIKGKTHENSKEAMLDELKALGALTPGQFKKLANEVSYTEAKDSLKRLKKLEESAPTAGEVARGGGVGALVMPLSALAWRAVAGPKGRVPGPKGPQQIWPGVRPMAATAAQGAVLGGMLPAGRHQLEQEVEKQKLKEYAGERRRGTLRGQIRKTLGV